MGRILIVEDDVVLRKHLARLFTRADYAVTTAGSRAEALDEVGRTTFDALLLDINLPDGDGLDLVAELGQHRPGRTLVMTAFATAESEVRARELGVCPLLRKPLDLFQLTDAVRIAKPTYET
jgi:DNA-binding response OmpR family regulator